MSDDDSGNIAYNIVIGILYAVAVGVNVYLIVDRATDGQLSRNMSVRLAYMRQRITHAINVDREAKKGAGAVIWEATNIIEGNQ